MEDKKNPFSGVTEKKTTEKVNPFSKVIKKEATEKTNPFSKVIKKEATEKVNPFSKVIEKNAGDNPFTGIFKDTVSKNSWVKEAIDKHNELFKEDNPLDKLANLLESN